ncbi:MAG: nickel-dependent lactate racemase [Candidatus Bipolaricaulia bacterium]
MPRIELPYGKGSLEVDVPSENLIGVLEGRATPPITLDDAFEQGWESPIGIDDPCASFKQGDSVVLVVTDHTRPTPTRKLLPLIWGRLRATVEAEDVTLLVATGTHRAPTDEELDAMLGDARHRFRVEIHDCHGDCVEVGRSSLGNPILLNRLVVDADHVVTIGHIGMHYYAGYSGGRKNVFPGVAGGASIEANHALMDRPKSTACVYDGNPISEEMVEAAKRVRYDFIVDVVLSVDGGVAKVVVGEPEAAHRVGRAFWDEHFQVRLDEQADLVIGSAGGHPKDINLYQAHKGEYNASLATRDSGLAYLAGACPNGIGHPVFADWIERSSTPDDVLHIYEQEGFRLGGHKAVYLARDRKRIELALQSELEDGVVRKFFMIPMHDPSEALDLARARFGEGYRVLVMPHAANTFPVLPCP